MAWSGRTMVVGKVIVGAALSLAMLVSRQSIAANTYEAGTPPTVSVTIPSNNNGVWLAGSDHPVKCTASDTDKCTNDKGQVSNPNDTVTVWWTGSGSFKNNNNVGNSVVYICTDTAGDNTITANADDNRPAGLPEGTPANDALFEEAAVSASRTVKAIIPVLHLMTYSGHLAIADAPPPHYLRDPAKSEPGAFIKNKPTGAKALTRFWHATSLTASSKVVVEGLTSGTDMNHWKETNATFGTTWPSAVATHQGGAVADKIVKATYSASWHYKVPTGSNEWIDMNTTDNHVAYVMWDAPKNVAALYKKANIDLVVGWANDCDRVDTTNHAKNTPRQVQVGVKAFHNTHGYKSTGIKPDPFTWIPANKGDCITYADLMAKSMRILGIESQPQWIFAKTKKAGAYDPAGAKHYMFTSDKKEHWVSPDGDANGDGVKNKNEAGYPGVINGSYVKGSNPDHDAAWRTANAPWNFHGAASCAGHWWEITFDSTPDHDTEANMCAWPGGPVINFPARLYPGGVQ